MYTAKAAASGSVAATDAKVEVKHVEAKGQKGAIDNFDQLPFAAKASDLNVEAKMGGTPGKYTITFTYDENGIKEVKAAKE